MTDGGPLDVLGATRLIASFPGGASSRLVAIASVLAEEGFAALAVDLADLDVIQRIATILGGRAVIGVHGVRTADDLSKAQAAGATYALAPIGTKVLAQAAARRNLPLFAGALSPTEIAAAAATGAAGVLVHPAEVLGTNYAPHAVAAAGSCPLIVGGSSPYGVTQWLTAGAYAVVADSSLLSDAVDHGDLGFLRDRARNYTSEAQRIGAWSPPAP
jgi:2-dehydro-3-deoxyphosphogluconate aldolase / (4S)-4-hydroxy-2-oxoglutarate aldolase